MVEDGDSEKTISEYTLNMFADELVMKAILCSNRMEVGYLIKHLSKEKRELCRLLNSKHFYHRLGRK